MIGDKVNSKNITVIVNGRVVLIDAWCNEDSNGVRVNVEDGDGYLYVFMLLDKCIAEEDWSVIAEKVLCEVARRGYLEGVRDVRGVRTD